MPLKVSDIGEKGLIKRILKKSNKNIIKSSFFDDISIKSLNDDAALINFGDQYLVATSDMLSKSAHFPDEMIFKQVGKKVVTVNVSDLAAMGAKPLGIIVSVGLPKDMPLDDFDSMMDGIFEGCKEYGMMLIGGDTNESNELTISGTCLGIVSKENVLMKDGANSGDVVAVTGPLGLAAAGFEVLFNDLDLEPDTKKNLLDHALNPKARVKTGILLGETGSVTSATDITDGLASEIGEIVDSSSSGIGITIYEELLPIPDSVLEIGKNTNKNPFEFALYYGEDFEILLTIRKDVFNKIKDNFHLYKIGEVTSSGKMIIVNKEGIENLLTPRGWEHLTK
ncbi:MAG: thiamine-phosphate kinase [Methanobacterium sp.]|uniref:thiamine-phosphate kinase n=1 Tax=Methanobacterium sp. TaxID=2164 RepID=UPI003D65B52A|nr:thiamine-phosphate kinase [Methanobacterium sp.]